jgi:uncharacterized protein involved in copper resistance
MRKRWKKVAMIMLVGLLVAGPLGQIHSAIASPESDKAKVANDAAAHDLQQMMMEMDSMSKMPMTANEKAMMKMLHEMANTIKMLIDANKNLIDAIEHGHM